MKHLALTLAAALALVGCQSSKENATTKSGLDPEKFITTVDGKNVALYTLVNKNVILS